MGLEDDASVRKAEVWPVSRSSFKAHFCIPRVNLLSLCNRYNINSISDLEVHLFKVHHGEVITRARTCTII